MQENRVSFDNHQERINKILNNLEDIKKKDSEIVGELRSSMKTFVDETTPESEFTFNEASDYFTARRNEKVKWLDGINNRVDSDFKTAFFNFDMELNNLEHTIDQSIRRASELSGIKQKSDSHFRNTVNTLEHVKDKVKNVNSLCENIENVYASAESSTFNFENTCSNIVSEMSFYQPNGFVRSYELFKTLFFNIDQNQVQLSNLIKAVSGLDVRDKLYDVIVYVYLQKLKSFKSSYDGFSRTKLLELTKKMHAKLEVIFVEAQKTLESEISKSKGSENEFRAIYEHFKIVNENIDYFIKGFDYVDKTLRSKFNIQEFDRTIKMVSTYKDTLLSSVRRAFFENAKSLFKDRYSDFFTTFNSLNTNTFEGQLVSLFSTIRNLNQDLKNYLELHRSFFNDKDFKNSVYKFLSSEFAGSISSTQTLVNTLFREMKDTYDARIKSEVSQFNNSSSRFFDNMNTNDAHLFFDRYVATYKSVNSNIASVKLSYDNSSKKCDEILKNINSEFGDVFGIKMNYSIGTLYNNYYNDMKQIVTSTILKVGTQTTALLRSLKNTLDGRINSYVNEFRNVSSSTWSTLKLENSVALADSYVSKYNYLNSQINSTLNSYEQVLKNFESIKSTVKNEFDCELRYDVTTLNNGYVKEITNITNSTLSNLGNSLTSLMVALKNDYDNQIRTHVEGFRNVSLQFFDGMSWQNSSEFFDRYISTYNATYSQINRIIDLYKQAIQNIEKTKVIITNGFGYELKVRISSSDETFGINKMNYSIGTLYNNYYSDMKQIVTSTILKVGTQTTALLRSLKNTLDGRINSYVNEFRNVSSSTWSTLKLENSIALADSYVSKYNYLNSQINSTLNSYEQVLKNFESIKSTVKNEFDCELKYDVTTLNNGYVKEITNITNSTLSNLGNSLTSLMVALKNDYDNQIKAHVEGFRNVSVQFFDGMSWQNSSEFFDRYISTYNATYSQINRIIDLYNQAIQNIEKTKVIITNGFDYELKVRISSLDETFRNEIKDIYSNTLANAERMINVVLKDSKDRTQAAIKSYMKDFSETSLRFFDEMNMDNANKLFVSYTAEYNLLTTRITQTASSYEQNIAIVKGIAEKLKNVFGYDLKYQNYNLTSQYKEQANNIYNSAIERFERLLKSGIEKLKKEILTMKSRYETDISSEQLESLDDFDEINIYLKKILALYSKFLDERMATSNVFLQKNNDIIHDAKLSKTIKDIDLNDINISEKLINDKIDLLYRYVENMIKTVKQDFDQVVDAMTRNNRTLIRDYNTKIVIDVRKFKEVYTKMRDATADFVKSPLRLNIKAQYTSYLNSISSAYSSFLKKAFALMNENLKGDCISLLNLYIGNLEDAKDLYNQIASILKEDGINLQPISVDVNEYRKKFIDGCKEKFFTNFVAEALEYVEILSYQEFEVQAKEKLKFYSENVEDIKSYYDKYLLDKFERIGAKCTIENCTAISDENIKNTIIKILNSCSGEHFAMIFNDKRISLFFKMHMLKLYFENINNDNKNFNDNKCFIINFLINNLKSKEVSILDKDKLRENISDESIDACNVSRMKKMGFRSFLGRGMTSGGVKHAFKNLPTWRKKNEKD